MKFCSKCGFILNGSEKVCPNCGTKIKKSIFDTLVDETKKIFNNNEPTYTSANESIQHFDNKTINSSFNGNKKSNSEGSQLSEKSVELSKYFNKAECYYYEGNYSKSIEYCEKYLELDSTNWKVYNILGYSFFNLKEYKDAILPLKTVLNFNREKTDVLIFIADSYRFINENENAISNYDLILKYGPKNIRAITGKGLAFYNMEEYDKAISCFIKADGLGELDEESKHCWNECLTKKHEKNKIKKLPKQDTHENFNTLYERSKEYLSVNDYRNARDCLKKALSLKKDYDSLVLIAEAEYYLADYNNALTHCNEALHINVTYENYKLYGEILLGLKRYDEAIDYFLKALNINSSADIYSNIGFAYYLLGNESMANENFLKALSIQKNNPRALIGKALPETERSSYVFAEEVLNESDNSLESMFANCLMFIYIWETIYGSCKPYQECERELKSAIISLNKASLVFKELNIDKRFWLVEMAFEPIINILAEYIRKDDIFAYISEERDMIKISSILIDVFGENEELCTIKGQLYLMFHEYDDAINSFDDALSFNPEPINQCRLLSYKGLSYKQHAENKRRNKEWYFDKATESFNRSIMCYNKLLLSNPDNIDILTEKAYTLYFAGRRAEALLCVEEILRIDPNNIIGRMGFGRPI